MKGIQLIYTLTINPAIDRLIYLDRFIRNQTNRPSRIIESIGGKGTHVSVNLKILGEDNKAVLLSGGNSGKKLITLLHNRGVDTEVIDCIGIKEIRTNTIIVEENSDSTIISENGELLSIAILDSVIQRFQQWLKPSDVLVLSGDARNVPSSFYAELIKEFSGKGVKIFLDASGEPLKRALKAGPFLVKPNLNELSQIWGNPLDINDCRAIMHALHTLDNYPVEVVALSLGSEGSLLKFGSTVLRAHAPTIKVINTVGCGDAYLAGLVYGFKNNLRLDETLILATAISTATAADESSVGFNINLIEGLIEQVRVESI